MPNWCGLTLKQLANIKFSIITRLNCVNYKKCVKKAAGLKIEISSRNVPFGLEVNLEQTKFQAVATSNPHDQVHVNGESQKKIVELFVYLVSQISDSGECKGEVNIWIAPISSCMKELNKGIWKSRVTLTTTNPKHVALTSAAVWIGNWLRHYIYFASELKTLRLS